MAGVRCFVALPLPACLTGPLLDAGATVRETDHAWEKARWVPQENLHITLKFLGEIPERELESLSDAIESSVRGAARFDLPLAGVRAVPSSRKARILWASFLDPDGQAHALAAAIERAALPFGVPLDERSFQPHATLARSRRPTHLDEAALAGAARVLEHAPHAMSVATVTFASSRLTPHGARYRDIAQWELEDADGRR